MRWPSGTVVDDSTAVMDGTENPSSVTRGGWRPRGFRVGWCNSTWDVLRGRFRPRRDARCSARFGEGAYLLMGPVEAADADVHHAALARGAVDDRRGLEGDLGEVRDGPVGGGYPPNLRPHDETGVVTPSGLRRRADARRAPEREWSGERGPKANHRCDVRGHRAFFDRPFRQPRFDTTAATKESDEPSRPSWLALQTSPLSHVFW